MNQDGSLVTKLANVISVQERKGEAYEEKVQADSDSIIEHAIKLYPLVKEAIAYGAFPSTCRWTFMLAISAGTSGEKWKLSGFSIRLPEARGLTMTRKPAVILRFRFIKRNSKKRNGNGNGNGKDKDSSA